MLKADVPVFTYDSASDPPLRPNGASSPPAEHPAPAWPAPPDPLAFHGPAGDFVRLLDPHTEADPVAILIQTLVAFGNAVGHGPHFRIEGDLHHSNLNVVLVAPTGKGRKGTSWGRVRQLFAFCDPEWVKNHLRSGLSSGEGLVYFVRDAVVESKEVRDKSGRVTGYQDVVKPGVDDKRLLVIEPEFSSVLCQLDRKGNTLSAEARQAFDSGILQIMNKNSPLIATGAHISIIGHITGDELRRKLGATEQGNGFANRFLWPCSTRSKFLPHGGQICESDLADVIAQFRRAIEFGREQREMPFDSEAYEFWEKIYMDLSTGKPGLLGAVTSRAEVQTRRLAMIFALLDCSPAVCGPHLKAALAVWEYTERSCAFIFGDATGNPDADVILRALRGSVDGLNRTDLNRLFAGHRPADAISRACEELRALGLIRMETRPTDGRPVEYWTAVR